MKYCDNCGASNTDLSIKCRYCGEPLQTEEESNEKLHNIIKDIQGKTNEPENKTFIENNINQKTLTMSNGLLYFLCALFCIIPQIGAIMSCMVWGKENTKQAYLLRLWTGIGVLAHIGTVIIIFLLIFCLIAFNL